jgi:hypothetical protein
VIALGGVNEGMACMLQQQQLHVQQLSVAEWDGLKSGVMAAVVKWHMGSIHTGTVVLCAEDSST